MTVFTESMARMVAMLAETGREVCVELHDDRICVRCPAAPKAQTDAKRNGRSPKTFEAYNAATGKNESHTVEEWCRLAGDGTTSTAMRARIKRTGSAATRVRKSKFEKKNPRKRVSA